MMMMITMLNIELAILEVDDRVTSSGLRQLNGEQL